MAIPLIYNVRNLRVRAGATVMTALGVALTVAIAIFIMMLLSGLDQAFHSTGNPLNVMALRKGSDSELTSFMSNDTFLALKTLPGVATDKDDPLISGEMLVAVVLPRRNGTGEANVVVRGMSPMGLKMRPGIKLAQGRWFQEGQHEIVVSRSVVQRFQHANLGEQVMFGKSPWTVVGIFDGSGTSYDSEIWGDVNQMKNDFDRPGYSSAVLRATDPIAADALTKRLVDDQRIKLDGILETEYYAKQTRSGMFIQWIGTIVAIIMAVGSSFAAMNTMYAAVAYRGREIATLRIMGFNRPSILTSFVFESLLLSLLGGAAAVLLMLPFNGMTTGTWNAVSFSEVVFHMRMTPVIVATAVGFAALMGLIGGIAPAWHASRQNILNALRD
ncbi:MAG TPA: ABC transporter permease [Terriglobales bacterium]|nr:ABC transporter permease [Terriglobales bacterium]